ncbi:unnamed protein product [Paramecium sonneborni]|uniref:Uncharacterized protein n=1 Tax=Paramecium sonneborni TaxID=65129 RepID=A0A8S1LBG4_9CILI|nr:unnamed protein product [Paramecium sonneborni]
MVSHLNFLLIKKESLKKYLWIQQYKIYKKIGMRLNNYLISQIKIFEELNLSKHLLRVIFSYGFERSSIIQQKDIKSIIIGKDVLAQVQSDINLNIILFQQELEIQVHSLLVPYKEQIKIKERHKSQYQHQLENGLNKYMIQSKELENIYILNKLCIFGQQVQETKEKCKQGVYIIQERLINLMKNKYLDANFMKLLVVDEADQILYSEQLEELIYMIEKELQLIFKKKLIFCQKMENIITLKLMKYLKIQLKFKRNQDEKSVYINLKQIFIILNLNYIFQRIIQSMQKIISSLEINPQQKFLHSPTLQNITFSDNNQQFIKKVQITSSEQNSHDSLNYPIIVLIICILMLIFVLGIILEVQRRKKLKKDIEQKLLQEKLCSIQNNKVKINQIYDSVKNSCWILQRINNQKCSTKILKFKIIQADHNKLELQITQDNQQEAWTAEGNILISSNQEIIIHLRTSLDSDLFQKKDSIDYLYLLQQYQGTFLQQENKFEGSWKVYGSLGLNNQNLSGSFELQKVTL